MVFMNVCKTDSGTVRKTVISFLICQKCALIYVKHVIAIVCLQRWHTHQLVKVLVKLQMNHTLLYWLATSGLAHRRMTKPPLIKHYFCHESQLHTGLKIPAHSCTAGVICFLKLYYLTQHLFLTWFVRYLGVLRAPNIPPNFVFAISLF